MAQDQTLQDLLLGVAWSTLEFDQADADVKRVRDALNQAVEAMKEVTGYDERKKQLEHARSKVVTHALAHLSEKRTFVPGVGYVDVTPQNSTAEVANMWTLLADPAAHQFIESITLTESAAAHLMAGREIPGVKLVDQLPKVRMSVKEYLERLGG